MLIETATLPKARHLQLPVEIRLRIFNLALQNDVHPQTSDPSRTVTEVQWPRIYKTYVHKRPENYWGTERMTRLLRVNR